MNRPKNSYYENEIIPYASTNRRMAASLLDYCISALLTWVYFLLKGKEDKDIFNAIFLFWILLPIVFECSPLKGSIGKKILKIYVISSNDSAYLIKALYINMFKYIPAIFLAILFFKISNAQIGDTGLGAFIYLIIFGPFSVIFYISDLLSLGISDKGQTLHDRLCNTSVFEKQP